MKKVLAISAVVMFISMGFTSCKRCQVCKKDSEPTIRVCEKDYSSNTEYGLTLDVYEAQGYDCKTSL